MARAISCIITSLFCGFGLTEVAGEANNPHYQCHWSQQGEYCTHSVLKCYKQHSPPWVQFYSWVELGGQRSHVDSHSHMDSLLPAA